MPRLPPQTAYSVIADDEANRVSLENEKLPLPSNTERKRQLQTNTTDTLNKNVIHREVHFRVPSEASTKAPMQVKTNIDELANKKRKTGMSMESSSLAQHLMMGQPKLSRVQQIYRQKTKALLKSQMKHRVPVPVPQGSSSNSQKVNIKKQEENLTNIIQEVPIQLPKQQIENILNQVSISNPSISTDNNQATTKKSILTTAIIKPGNTSTNNNSVVSQQQAPLVSSTSEVAQQKSIKICPARKIVTTSVRTQPATQKLIIVSTPQGTPTSSILHHTLSSIPFVKTIAMKNLDKVKVINNPNLQNVTTNVTSTTNQKPKLLTVQTKTKGGTPGKQVSIPFIQGVQLQALQSKGAIKMLPFSPTKSTSKSTLINTTAGSVYIMNSNTSLPILTTSNTTPVVSVKTETKNNNEPEPEIKIEPNATNNIIILKNELIKSATIPVTKTEVVNETTVTEEIKDEKKSSVLAEILKASGVIPNDYNDPNDNDIESQISQLTEIPNANTHLTSSPSTNLISKTDVNINNEILNKIEKSIVKFDGIQNEILENTNLETLIKDENNAQIEVNHENIENDNNQNINLDAIIQEDCQNVMNFEETVMDIEQSSNNFVILEDNEEVSRTIHIEDQLQANEEVVELMGSLDPETGMYSMKPPQEFDLINDVESNTSQISSDAFAIEMQMEALHNSELDMPSLSN